MNRGSVLRAAGVGLMLLTGVCRAGLEISASPTPWVQPKDDSTLLVHHARDDAGGNTSFRFVADRNVDANKYPAGGVTVFAKADRQQPQRDRDLGQAFLSGDKQAKLDAVYLRIGQGDLAVLENAPGARIAVQWFEVRGQPTLNDHGTPGFSGRFDRVASPELDDCLDGETYVSLRVVEGRLPNSLNKGDYIKLDFTAEDEFCLQPRRGYAFLLMFLDRAPRRGMTLANEYYGTYAPDPQNKFLGHGIRREGMPEFPDDWKARLSQSPGTLGFPDVCTFRDLHFAIAVKPVTGAATPGLLKVSENKRYLVDSAGKPFFWLGDTAWELFHRLDRAEAELYLKDRAAKGFTVIQAVALSELNGLEEPNRYGHLPLLDKDPARPAIKDGPDNDYWDFVDEVLDLAEENGLYIGLLPTWGKYVTSSAFDGKVDGIFNTANALSYGQFLGRRYRGRTNIVWILGGDKAPSTPQAVDIWRAMAKGIAIGVADREDYDAVLMTYHTSGPGHVSDFIHNEPWLDFSSAQSSHGDLIESWRFIEKHWNRPPIKPVIDLESSYPDALIPAAWLPEPMRADHRSTKPSNDDHARRAAYWAVFTGAFGHTYGHNSIWQMVAPPRKPVLDAKLTWRQALDAPSAMQMGYLRGLVESRPFLTQVPDQTLIGSEVGTGTDHIRALRGDGYALIYTPSGKPFHVQLEKLSGKEVKACWFDPRTAQTMVIGQFPKAGDRRFTPPGQPGIGNDWVLVLDDPNRGLGLPRVALEPYDWRGFGGFDTYKWRGFLLANNRWGGGNGRIWFKDYGDRWSFWTEHSDDINGGHVKSFPHAGIGWMWGNWAPNSSLPIRLGDLAVAKSDWTVVLPENESNPSYVAYYQLYMSTQPDPKNDGAKISGDLALIIHRQDFPFEQWGKNLGEFEIAGRKMTVVHKTPAIGQSKYIILIPASPPYTQQGNTIYVKDFDIKACIDFCVANGFYQSSDYLITIQAGWESRVLHGILRSTDLKLIVGKKDEQPGYLPLPIRESADKSPG